MTTAPLPPVSLDGLPEPAPGAVAALAPTGTLRAAINMGNFLLVTGTDEHGDPVGVSPGMAAALAHTLGVGLELVHFPSPGSVADAGTEGVWDIGNIGAEPARAEFIDFTAAYAEIDATIMVRSDSAITSFADVDQPGVRIAAKARAAYRLCLERNLNHAELVTFASHDDTFAAFGDDDSLTVYAGLRAMLSDQSASLPGSQVLADRFTAVQQAIGTPKDRDPAGPDYLRAFVEAAKTQGVVAGLIEHHGVDALNVAPAAQ